MKTKIIMGNALKEMTLHGVWFSIWQVVMAMAVITWLIMGRNYFFKDGQTTAHAVEMLLLFAAMWLVGNITANMKEQDFCRVAETCFIAGLTVLNLWLSGVNGAPVLDTVGEVLNYALGISGAIAIVSLFAMGIKDMKN